MRKRLGLAASVPAVACVNLTGDPSESIDSVEQEIGGVDTAVGQAKEVRRFEFLEGNSNLGDALRLADIDDDAHLDDEDEDL